MINKQLAKQRGLSQETIEDIQSYQDIRDSVEEVAKKCSEKMLPVHFNEWMEINRHLQVLWGFDQDDRFIKFWDFPRCKCPKMDNEDNYPSKYGSIINWDCPVHKKNLGGDL